jgi:hypothetical protein
MSKCEHGKRKTICKECGGSAICEHGKERFYCKDCNGAGLCQHNKIKYSCKECGGGKRICEHGKYKTICKECGGSAICEHGKRRTICKECGGSAICEHGKHKNTCKECGGSAICEHGHIKTSCINCGCVHGLIKRYCKECGGSALCIHDKRKTNCKECNGSVICEHGKEKYYCKECGGSQICKHTKQKKYCKECGGSALCKTPLCETFSTAKYEGYCLFCYIHMFPDKPVSRNYKTKEIAVVDFVKTTFPDLTWITDKRVSDGCSKRRPDLLVDLGYQVIIIEVDENQHINYGSSCETKRMMELSQDVGERPIVFIRFNPDNYIKNETIITSCWGINKTGICVVKKSKKDEWDNRLTTLEEQIKYWLNPDNQTTKTVEIIQLFYDV